MSVPPSITIPTINEKHERRTETENDLYLLKRYMQLNLSPELYHSLKTNVMTEKVETFIKNSLIPLAKRNNISLLIAFFKLAIQLFPLLYMEPLYPLLKDANDEESRLRTVQLSIKFVRPTSSDHYITNRNTVQDYINFDIELSEMLKYSTLIFYHYIGYDYYDILIENSNTPSLDKITEIAKNNRIPLDIAIISYIYYKNKQNTELCESLAQLIQQQGARMTVYNFDHFKPELLKLIETSDA